MQELHTGSLRWRRETRGRRAATAIAVGLSLSLVSCGGGGAGPGGGTGGVPAETSQTPTETAQTEAPVESPLSDRLTLLLLRVGTAASERPGWRKLTLDVGVRNEAPYPLPIRFVSGGEGQPVATVGVKEGRAYEASLTYNERAADEPFGLNYRAASPEIGAFYAFQLPGGYALCGIIIHIESDGSEQVERLHAEAEVPETATPTTLTVAGYPELDLTTKAPPSSCKPSAPQPLRLPASVDLAKTEGSGPNAKLLLDEIEPASPVTNTQLAPRVRTIVRTRVQNMDRLDDFALSDFELWALDDDGVARSPVGVPSYDAYSRRICTYSLNPTEISVGPGQTMRVNICFPPRRQHRPVAFVIQSPTSNIVAVIPTG